MPGGRVVKRICEIKVHKVELTLAAIAGLKIKKWKYMERAVESMGKKLRYVSHDLDKFKDENEHLKNQIKELQDKLINQSQVKPNPPPESQHRSI